MRIKLVVATRVDEVTFYQATATGRSLAFNKPNFVDIRLFASNTEGLPRIYNQAIRECEGEPATLIFAHDDLHLLDFYWASRVREGLKRFQILGVAGNRRRLAGQPSWAFVDTALTWEKAENLSGVVGHGKAFPPSKFSYYGMPRQQVKLLDGLLLACDSETLRTHGLYFDERFDFHFYDMDFCRQAEVKGLTCGTWDLSLIHESGGSFRSEAWKQGYQAYLDKWGE